MVEAILAQIPRPFWPKVTLAHRICDGLVPASGFTSALPALQSTPGPIALYEARCCARSVPAKQLLRQGQSQGICIAAPCGSCPSSRPSRLPLLLYRLPSTWIANPNICFWLIILADTFVLKKIWGGGCPPAGALGTPAAVVRESPMRLINR